MTYYMFTSCYTHMTEHLRFLSCRLTFTSSRNFRFSPELHFTFVDLILFSFSFKDNFRKQFSQLAYSLINSIKWNPKPTVTWSIILCRQTDDFTKSQLDSCLLVFDRPRMKIDQIATKLKHNGNQLHTRCKIDKIRRSFWIANADAIYSSSDTMAFIWGLFPRQMTSVVAFLARMWQAFKQSIHYLRVPSLLG